LGLASEACLITSEEELHTDLTDEILAAQTGPGLPCPSRCDDGSRLLRKRFPTPVRLTNTYLDILSYLAGGEPALVRLEVREDLQFYQSGPYSPLWGQPMGDLWFLLLGYRVVEEGDGTPTSGPGAEGKKAVWRLRGPPTVGRGGIMELLDQKLWHIVSQGPHAAPGADGEATPFSDTIILSRARDEAMDW